MVTPPPPPPGFRPPDDASAVRLRTYEVIFEHEDFWGRTFDVVLILAILASVLAIMLESVGPLRAQWGPQLRAAEWFFTVLFTVEYAVRLWCVGKPGAYARSFLGVVDLLAFLPTYVSVLVPGGQVVTVVRILRVLRVFRILKLAQYVGEARLLGKALRTSRYKITVFVTAVLTITVLVGALMYLVEGPAAGFTSIPRGMYWAIVTLTTVGFGDITPLTPVGQSLASLVMILGYGIIAVPTGIVTVELAEAARGEREERARSGEAEHAVRGCPACARGGHDPDAVHCKWCGAALA